MWKLDLEGLVYETCSSMSSTFFLGDSQDCETFSERGIDSPVWLVLLSRLSEKGCPGRHHSNLESYSG